jgi:ribosomal protein S18 acetylase RimI-like enzyme
VATDLGRILGRAAKSRLAGMDFGSVAVCYSTAMEIRAGKANDFADLLEIDGTIESTHYLHVDYSTSETSRAWRLEERALREAKVTANPISEDDRFLLRQILAGAAEGVALVVIHAERPVALLLAQTVAAQGTLRLIDLRVDSDVRRQGIATALLLMLIGEARTRGLRALSVETRADNAPMYRLLPKCGFEIAGLDTRRHSNHDLVKESPTLLWYASLD